MSNDDLVNQDEIERLLQQSLGGKADKPAPAAGEKPAAGDPGKSSDETLGQQSIDALLGSGGKKPPAAKAPAPAAVGSSLDDSSKLLAQADIEKLLNEAHKTAPAPPRPAAVEERAVSTTPREEMPTGDIAYLFAQAQQAMNPPPEAVRGEAPPGVAPFRFEEFAGAPPSTENATLDLFRDVEMDLKIELGRTHMYLEDVLKLRRGSVVPLDKLAGDPVDIFVNGRLIARGEVLVLNDNFCVRVAELIAGMSSGVSPGV